jgi:tubulin polyglutamylase TTLL6/13
MLDYKCKPWLLEVNQSPSLATETALDHAVKFELVKDTLDLISLDARSKQYNFRDLDYRGTKD